MLAKELSEVFDKLIWAIKSWKRTPACVLYKENGELEPTS